MSRGKFSKPGQVRGKIIESIFVQPLRMTQTQKIITCMVFDILKFYKWILGDVYDWGQVS